MSGGRDAETLRLLRAYVVAREKHPRDVARHVELYKQLRARTFEDLRLVTPKGEAGSPAERQRFYWEDRD